MTLVPIDGAPIQNVQSYQLAFAFCLAFILLVPLAIAGLALINAGLGRSRSAAHALTSAVCVLGVAVLTYFAFGFAIQGYQNPLAQGGPFVGVPYVHSIPRGFFFRGMPWGSVVSLETLLGVFSVGMCSIIPLGATADRWRLPSACASTILLAGFIYPVFVRWEPGLFVMLGSSAHGLGDLLDAGGSGFIHVTGGVTALSLTWLLGPRQGKYSSHGVPAAIPAHNVAFVLFGCTLAWAGWLGLNSAGAMLYTEMQPERAVLVIINTTFAASAAAIAAAATTRIRFRRPDASLIANGWMAGLVASSAGCAVFKPAIAILVGLVAGGLVVLSVEFFEFTLKVDDPCGSVSVHAVCGIWGLLAVGVFVGGLSQFLAQLVGVATLLGFILPLAYGLNWLLGRFIPHRVSIDGERQGLDLHELGADAYPEFVVHADEFMQR